MKIHTCDLYNQKFSEEVLIENLDHLNLKIVLNTQKLSAKFCIDYILCMDIDSGDEDSYLFDVTHIMNKQPHIQMDEWIALRKESTNK